jgi:hypothetical protein
VFGGISVRQHGRRHERTYTADWSSGPSIAWQDEAGVDAKPILKQPESIP